MVPLTLVGTWEAFSPHDRTIHRGRSVRLVIGQPIDPKEHGPDEAMKMVERAIHEAYATHRHEVVGSAAQPQLAHG